MLSLGTRSKLAALKDGVTLRPHQERAVEKVRRSGGSLLVAHPVGSGKTPVGVGAVERLREDGKASKALIVTPASLRSNFGKDGVGKFSDQGYVTYGNAQESSRKGSSYRDINTATPGTSPTYGIVSSDLFRKDPHTFLRNHGADTVVLDEAHRIRNDQTDLYKAFKEVRPQIRNFIGLTGSPVSNSPADIVPVLDVVTNGKHSLGTKSGFTERYLRKNPNGTTTLLRQKGLQKEIAPHVDYLSPEEFASDRAAAPKKRVRYVKTPMSKEQAKAYRWVMQQLDPVTRRQLSRDVEKLTASQLNGLLARLTKARQVSNSVSAAYDIPLSEAARETPKLRRLIQDIEEHHQTTPDGRVLVVSNLLRGGLNDVSAGLTSKGIEHGLFLGKGNPGVTEDLRQRAVTDFNAGKTKTLLVSGAGAEGLNLPDTTMVSVVDGHFNPEMVSQREARGIRTGGQSHRPEAERAVDVRRYVSTLPKTRLERNLDTVAAATPVPYLARALRGEKVFRRPGKEKEALDDMIYRIAHRKNRTNADLRALLENN